MNNAEKLHRISVNVSNTNIQTYKYKLFNSKTIKDQINTKDFIDLLKYIDHDSNEYKIFIGLLDKRVPIVIKIGTHKKLADEYKISKLLHDVPHIINVFGVLSCNNQLNNINLNKPICNPYN